MKVRELITLLTQMPADADVVVKGYEGGVDDALHVALTRIRRDVNKEWYYGRHEIDETGDVQAVFIAGSTRPPE